MTLILTDRIIAAVGTPYSSWLVYDSVTRADSTTTPGSATEKGGAWTVVKGTWGVQSGKLYSVTKLNQDSIMIGSTFNGIVQWDGRTTDHSSGSGCGTYIRFRAAGTGLPGTVDALFFGEYSGFLSLSTYIGGTYTTVVNLSLGQADNVTYTYKVEFRGTLITMSKDGTVVATYTLTGPAAALAGTLIGTHHAGNPSGGATATWDNFQVLP